MKRKLFKKTVVVVFVVFAFSFVCLTQTYGANSVSSKVRLKPQTTNQKIQKVPARRINWTAVSPSNFKPDMTFGEAIIILRNTTVPPLNIVVLWRHLERNAGIDRETPIGIDGVSGVPLRTHLKLLLTSLSADSLEEIGYIVNGGVIIISTKNSLPNNLKTRIYDVTDLVGAPAGGGFMPGFGMPFGFGGMPFGGGMSFGLGGMLGGMTPFGGSGYTGQGQAPYGNLNSR